MELETAASTVEVTDSGIVIRWSDGGRSRFHSLWLRDNCPSGGDKYTAFRTFSVIDLNPELFVLDVERNDNGDLAVEFSDGHESVFDFEWLRANAHEPHDRLGKMRSISHFRAGATLPFFDLPRRGSEVHCDLLDAVARWGAAIVNGVPADETGLGLVASLVGRIRETDVELDEGGVDQTGPALEPRTHDAYRYAPAGTTILHCVEVGSSGSDSLFIDGFAIASDLRDRDPDAFDQLADTKVPFVRHRFDAVEEGEDVHLLAYAPVVTLDRDAEIAGIRFDERSMAPLDIDPGQLGAYYRALIEFTKWTNDPARALHFRFEPGQAVVYDNQRVLYGGSTFGSDDEKSHLRRCTIDRDEFHSRLRRLRAVHDRPGVNERLPSGSST